DPRLLLHAACLAGALRGQLQVVPAAEASTPEFRRWLAFSSATRPLYTVGRFPVVIPHTALPDAAAVRPEYIKHLAPNGRVEALVVANPADLKKGGTAAMAPLLAVRHKAALVLTDDTGENVADVVREALKEPALAKADTLILAGGLEALPMERRPNPVFGKDATIEMD